MAEIKKNKKKRTLLQKIVNVFLVFFLSLFVLILILFGITQTATFREFLRDKVLEIANSELNGHLDIGRIDGTIFTSLILNNIIVSMEKDTILSAEKIEVRTSPLKLLAKEIFIRKFEIKNARLKLVADEEGKLNLAKLFPESEEDTTSSEFPFTIEARDMRLTNLDLSFRNYNIPEKGEIHKELVFDDLRIRDLNMLFEASMDINNNDFRLQIKQFAFNPNVNSFSLKELSGTFYVNEKMLKADGLRLLTGNSDINLTAELTGYNVFDTTGASKFGDASLSLNMSADKFNFNDLARLTSVKMMTGELKADIEGKGTVKDFVLDNLEIDLANSHLQTSGLIKNLDNPDSILLAVKFNDTYINQTDIKNLMPGADIPVYKEYGVLRFDTLNYSGTFEDFDITILLRTDKGEIYADAGINMQKKDIAYDATLNVKNLDISPLAGLQTNLNIRSDFKGIGTEPSTILADINLIGDGSVIEGNKLDSLRLTADSKNSVLNYNLIAVKDTITARLAGYFNFENKTNPVYELQGTLRNLNLAAFTEDSTAESDLNFNITASGESFNPDSINLFVNMNLEQSVINGIKIDTTRAIIDLQNGADGERVINIISDLADITFAGKFSVDQATDVFSKEAYVLKKLLNEQLQQITHSDSVFIGDTLEVTEALGDEEKSFVDSVMSIKYLVDFKDFTLLSLFLGNKSQIEIDGEMSGNIRSDGDSLHFTYNTSIQYIKYRSESDVFFLSNLNLNVNLQNSLDTTSNISRVAANLNLTTDRIFMGSNINGLALRLSLKNGAALMDFKAQLEDYAAAHLKGGFNVSGDFVFLNLDTLNLNYKGLNLTNPQQIRIGYSEDEIRIQDFVLQSDSAEIRLDGTLLRSGNQNMKLAINNLSLNKISTTVMGARPENALSAMFNLNAEITGSLDAPEADLSFRVDSIKYKNQSFGYLESDVTYKNNIIDGKIRFIDSTINATQPALLITAEVPFDLSGEEQTASAKPPMSIKFTARDFNLAAFGDILPAINKLRGKLNAELNITGTPDNLQPQGYFELIGGAFFVEANNLEYYANMKVNLQENNLTLEHITIQNSTDTPDGGTMTGSGTAKLDNMEIVSSSFTMNGSLKILSPNSKTASASVYGDLVIATDGNIEFTMGEEGSNLKAPIIVKKANLTFPPTQGAYENKAVNFVYKYAEDTTISHPVGMDFESLVELSRQKGQTQEIKNSEESKFDYTIDIKLENEAKVIFVLSKELNQNLTAVLKGNISYSYIDGKSIAKGELKLLEGSTLEFIKTLSADGSIKFENELSNPFLDITATYRDYYYPADSSSGAQEIQVAVKIKIRGFLNELDKTFIREENNIAVYYGESNIEQDTPDPTKTPTDAIMFIITGRFASDLSQSERTDAAGQFSGTATAMAGSLLGGFLNRQFGDYVKSVELRKVGTETKFNLSGRVKNFRYTIGGSTDVFEDLSQANIKIEYPIFENFLLRLERKEAIMEKTINAEMINELGLKYRFQF